MDLCNLNEIRALLTRHGFHFSKAKGQNFLIASWVPQRIARDAGVGKDCGALEIGPGIGPLTKELCAAAGKVVAVEIDTSLRPVLAETMADAENLELIFGDFLKMDTAELVGKLDGLHPMACANLPYYITSPILTKLLESRAFESVTVMVQKEVAQRICAKPATADYGAFTVFCQYFAEPTILFDVPPDCFVPQPKVTSAVVQLKTRIAPPCEIADETLFFRVVRGAFAQRRKTLLNSISSTLGEKSKAEWEQVLCDCGIAPTVRGETLAIADFAKIANRVSAEKKA